MTNVEHPENLLYPKNMPPPEETELRFEEWISKRCRRCERLFWSRWIGRPRRKYLCPRCRVLST